MDDECGVDISMNEPVLGIAVDPTPRPFPKREVHHGVSVSLEPLAENHIHELWDAAKNAEQSWTYLRYGPFSSADALASHVRNLAGRADQPFWAVRPRSNRKVEGWLSFCDIYPADAAIEIGSIWFSPRLQRTRAATEAILLLMQHAFDELGYTRLVWRCQALNTASRRAAGRYGFKAEGIWRAAAVVKGWQRDVAWHSMLADEWPSHKAALLAWLDDNNFDATGIARSTLAEIRERAQGSK
ncbi:GNAT family N-acetyltransferase [Mesorhizobium sp. CO1-1-11]|uniref:GNAT family N-acetyltransferase n=1 Tax=Mesorhizobium sp. CO1-1-11 TaxID=2876636 RepID=UPI001CCDD744|nr:GNAT family protein [Mesorhizobium sp. CO1-1-11]MBZ9725806.1 GNAT family N-acetyltransferase [Mesorhizobium sp. CO1-1-11]